MGYIIKNITNKLDKRHPFANTPVEFTYEKKNFSTDTVTLHVGREIVLEGELPISVHNLRIKGFIIIKKISDNELHAFLKKNEEENKAKNLAVTKQIVSNTPSKDDTSEVSGEQFTKPLQFKKKRNISQV